MVMAAVRAAVKAQSAMALDGAARALLWRWNGGVQYISAVFSITRTHTHVSMEELWYISFETKPALSPRPLPRSEKSCQWQRQGMVRGHP